MAKNGVSRAALIARTSENARKHAQALGIEAHVNKRRYDGSIHMSVSQSDRGGRVPDSLKQFVSLGKVGGSVDRIDLGQPDATCAVPPGPEREGMWDAILETSEKTNSKYWYLNDKIMRHRQAILDTGEIHELPEFSNSSKAIEEIAAYMDSMQRKLETLERLEEKARAGELEKTGLRRLFRNPPESLNPGERAFVAATVAEGDRVFATRQVQSAAMHSLLLTSEESDDERQKRATETRTAILAFAAARHHEQNLRQIVRDYHESRREAVPAYSIPVLSRRRNDMRTDAIPVDADSAFKGLDAWTVEMQVDPQTRQLEPTIHLKSKRSIFSDWTCPQFSGKARALINTAHKQKRLVDPREFSAESADISETGLFWSDKPAVDKLVGRMMELRTKFEDAAKAAATIIDCFECDLIEGNPSTRVRKDTLAKVADMMDDEARLRTLQHGGAQAHSWIRAVEDFSARWVQEQDHLGARIAERYQARKMTAREWEIASEWLDTLVASTDPRPYIPWLQTRLNEFSREGEEADIRRRRAEGLIAEEEMEEYQGHARERRHNFAASLEKYGVAPVPKTLDDLFAALERRSEERAQQATIREREGQEADGSSRIVTPSPAPSTGSGGGKRRKNNKNKKKGKKRLRPYTGPADPSSSGTEGVSPVVSITDLGSDGPETALVLWVDPNKEVEMTVEQLEAEIARLEEEASASRARLAATRAAMRTTTGISTQRDAKDTESSPARLADESIDAVDRLIKEVTDSAGSRPQPTRRRGANRPTVTAAPDPSPQAPSTAPRSHSLMCSQQSGVSHTPLMRAETRPSATPSSPHGLGLSGYDAPRPYWRPRVEAQRRQVPLSMASRPAGERWLAEPNASGGSLHRAPSAVRRPFDHAYCSSSDTQRSRPYLQAPMMRPGRTLPRPPSHRSTLRAPPALSSCWRQPSQSSYPVKSPPAAILPWATTSMVQSPQYLSFEAADQTAQRETRFREGYATPGTTIDELDASIHSTELVGNAEPCSPHGMSWADEMTAMADDVSSQASRDAHHGEERDVVQQSFTVDPLRVEIEAESNTASFDPQRSSAATEVASLTRCGSSTAEAQLVVNIVDQLLDPYENRRAHRYRSNSVG